jgi:tetratricopeptide (TPR) repeat protein
MTQNNDQLPLVVILSGQADQSTLSKGANRAGFQTVCVSSNKELAEALAKQPWGLVHNLRAFEPKQNYLLQQRLARSPNLTQVTRFIIAPEITTPALALVADCGIRQVFNLASVLSGNLGEQLNILRQTDNARGDAQKLIHARRIIESNKPSKEFLEAVNDAYASFPHDPVIRLEYAFSKAASGDFNEAGTLAKRLLQVETHNVRAMNLLAKVQLSAGDLEGSLKLLDVANRLCPSNPDRLALIGTVHSKKGDLQLAKKAFLEALDVYPAQADARDAISTMPLSAAEVESAVHSLRGILSEKDRAALLNKAAIAAVNEQAFDDAVRIYGYAIEHLKENDLKASVYYNLGLAYKKMGDAKGAVAKFNECLKLQPNHEHAQQNINELSG